MRKKVFMEEVVAGRRAVTSLFICAALHRGKNDGKKFIGIKIHWDLNLWQCNPATFLNSQ